MNLKSKVIKHWEANLENAQARELPNTGPYECYYCLTYIDRQCNGCPIKTATGQRMCRDTPYAQVMEALVQLKSYIGCPSEESYWDPLIKAIEKELEFLHSLPEDQEE